MASVQLLKVTNTINSSVTGIADHVLVVDNRLTSVDDRVASIDSRVACVDDRLKAVDHKLAAVIDGTQYTLRLIVKIRLL